MNGEKIINLTASIVTLINALIAIPTIFFPEFHLINFKLFSGANIITRLTVLLLLETSLSYLLAFLHIIIDRKFNDASLMIGILLTIISTAITFYNVELIIIRNSYQLIDIIDYLPLFFLLWAISEAFLLKYYFEIKNIKYSLISISVVYIVFMIAVGMESI